MYSDLIVDHFTAPDFVGDIENPQLEFEIGNSVCGDRIRVQVNTAEGVVTDIAYRAWGCATSVATGDIFCESVKHTSLSDLISRCEHEIGEMLGELEPSQQHCIHILNELHQTLIAEAQAKGEQ